MLKSWLVGARKPKNLLVSSLRVVSCVEFDDKFRPVSLERTLVVADREENAHRKARLQVYCKARWRRRFVDRLIYEQYKVRPVVAFKSKS
jgi:hypothetical protein